VDAIESIHFLKKMFLREQINAATLPDRFWNKGSVRSGSGEAPALMEGRGLGAEF
jgi:hypothetical protein